MRWHDPDPARTQGRVQWFGFPLYYMKKDQAQETFNRSIDWFRSVYEPVAVRLSHLSAARACGGAVLRWGVSHAVDHAGFHVYRQVSGEDRVRLTEHMLSGRTEYEFVDPSPPAGEADYWLAETSRVGVVTWLGPAPLAAEGGLVPALTLSPVFPNPITGAARIRFSLATAGRVTLEVFDIQGRRAATVLDEVREAGPHEASWDGRTDRGDRAARGLYFIRLQTVDQTRIQKAVLAR
jgi:hypothetical protein